MLEFLFFTLLLGEAFPAIDRLLLYIELLLLFFDLLETELFDLSVLLLRRFTASFLSALLFFLFDFISESLRSFESRPLSELLPVLSIRLPLLP